MRDSNTSSECVPASAITVEDTSCKDLVPLMFGWKPSEPRGEECGNNVVDFGSIGDCVLTLPEGLHRKGGILTYNSLKNPPNAPRVSRFLKPA